MATDLSMTFVDSNSYRGFKKYISGKVFYLGADEQQAKVKLLTILLEQASGQKVFLGELPPKPEQPTNDITLFQVMDQYQDHVKTLAVSETWRHTVCHRVKTLKRYLKDIPLASIDYDRLTQMANAILARPTTTRGTAMSSETAVNLVKSLRGLMNWLDASGRWPGFRRWENCLTVRGKLKSDQYGKIAMLSLDEYVKAYEAASERMRCYMLVSLNTGMTQTELATLTPIMIDLEKGRIERHRHKTNVWAGWSLWPTTIEALRAQMNTSGPLALTTADGQPLVHYKGSKTDSIRQAWTRLVVKSGIRKCGFKTIRKLGTQLIRELAGLEAAQMYLAHKGSSVAERHYSNPLYKKLDEALSLVGRKVEGMLPKPEMRVVGQDSVELRNVA